MNDLVNLNGVSALAAMRVGEISAEALTLAYLSHIETVNPSINAIRQIFKDSAITQALAVDRQRQSGEALGPLAGLPVVIKENCDIEGAVCSAGLSFREDYIATQDAWVTQKLKKAGAIIVGQAISDPGAFGVRTSAVTHPLKPELTVGGSSGGSAAALAATMCLGAIGTDTGGSIRIPSACCGTVGLKPSFAALPMKGIFPLVHSLDHVGPMARNVSDVELLWNALADQQSSTSEMPKTIGFDPKYIAEADTKVQAEWDRLLNACEHMGIKCLEVDLPELDIFINMHIQLFLIEATSYHLAHHSEHRQAYPEVVQQGFDMALNFSVKDYVNLCTQRVNFTRQLNTLFEQVDLLLNPTLVMHEPLKYAEQLQIADQAHDFTLAMVRQTCLFDHTGHPALAMPMSQSTSAVPASVQLVAAHGRENAILGFAKQLEKQLLHKTG